MTFALKTKPGDGLIVNRVVDSLDVRIYRACQPSDWLKTEYAVWDAFIQEKRHGEHLCVEVPNLGTFKVQPSRKPYRIVLINDKIGDIRIWNLPGWHTGNCAETGMLYVSFRSEFLQFNGLAGAKAFIEQVRALFFSGSSLTNSDNPSQVTYGADWCRISRADLAVDQVRHERLKWADIDNYVCRSRVLKDTLTTPYGKEVHETVKDVSRVSNDVLRSCAPKPQLDNKGVHKTVDQRNGCSARPRGEVSELEQIAARTLAEFAEHVQSELGIERQAAVSRVLAARTPQTVYFGRKDGHLYLREYNKLLSIPQHDKLYMLETWRANGWTGAGGVWRCEFSMDGDFLRQFVDTSTGERVDLRELDLFEAWIPRVWGYLTHTWIRHTVNDRGVRRGFLRPAERPCSARWKTVQQAWGEARDYKRVRRTPEPVIDQMMKQVKGCLATIAAKLSPGTKEIAFPKLLGNLTTWSQMKETEEKVLERRKLFGDDDYSDSALSAMFRADRMRLGRGS